jgi:peptidoglycan/LPS O-acetylase OafA/YrhL
LLYHLKDVHFVFITNPILIEFAFGLCLSICYRNARDINIIFPVLSLILGLFFYGYYIFNGYGVFSEAEYVLAGVTSLQRAIFWGIPSFLIVFGLLFIERAMKEKFFASNIFLLLGDASYSIYLIHPIILLLFAGLWKRLPIVSTYISMDLLVIILLMLAIVFGIIFHKKVESPFLRKIINKK